MKAAVVLAALGLFLVTWVVRFLALVGFPNDHFLYLSSAQQILAGEWPSKDFVDPGTPLMYVASAVARMAVGAPLLAEAFVISTTFGIAAGLTLYAAFAVSGSLLIAVPAAIAEVAMFPRSYHYPKLLVVVAGLLAMWSYARQPSWSRAAVLAGCTVVAFLFRHDLGLYVGLAAVVTAVMTGGRWRDRARRVAQIGGLAALFVLPYLVYVQATTGIARHLTGGIAYSREEFERTMLTAPVFDPAVPRSDHNVRTALFYTFHLLPAMSGALIVWGARRRAIWARADAPMIVPLAVLAVATNVAFLRDPLQERLADAAAPACILSAWLIRRAWASTGWRRIVGCSAVAVVSGIVATGANVVGRPAEQINRAGFTLPRDRFLEHVRDRVTELQAPLAPRQFPGRVVHALVPFLEYVGRCTTPAQRLFVAGNAPEVYVFAGRLFAGGQPMLRSGYFSTMGDQRRLVLLPVDEDDSILVRVNRRSRPSGTDAATGYPCFM